MTRSPLVVWAMLGGALCAISVGVVLDGGRDDVFADSDVARQRMEQLAVALKVYVNDHDGQMPEDLADLYPDYVSDPLTFWHPGDADPPPTTIDNSIPNAPNSARISFEFAADVSDLAPDGYVVWDNTADNNEGLFINMLTRDEVWETDPPVATPTPTFVMLAQAHLRRLGLGLSYYTNDYEEYFPDDLIRLWSGEGGPFASPRTFWNPGDSQPLPADITNSILDAPDSAQVSFEYLVAGLTLEDVTPETVLLRDITPANNGGHGINLVKGDLSVGFVPVHSFGDHNGDCHIDLADLASLQTCFTGSDECILDDACRVFDWNSDHRVDSFDFQRFSEELTGPDELIPDCPP